MSITFVAGDVLTAAQMNTLAQKVTWTSYTPTWHSTGSAPSIGNGTITGRYAVVDKICFVEIVVLWGSTTTNGSGAYRWGLPSSYNFAGQLINPTGFDGYNAVGKCTFWDASIDEAYSGTVDCADGNDRVTARYVNVAGTYGVTASIAATVPIGTPANGDILMMTAAYRIA